MGEVVTERHRRLQSIGDRLVVDAELEKRLGQRPAAAGQTVEAMTAAHRDHRWEVVVPCVWCKDCDVRLYQGSLPIERRRQACQEGEHRWNDEIGLGFYSVCESCGLKEWFEE